MLGQLSSVKPSDYYRVAGSHANWFLQLNVTLATRCMYSAFSSGSRPKSILRDDVRIETILGQHHAADQHLEEALRDSVKERLSLLLGRRKGRSLDLGLLQRLPAAELVQACRQARLHIPSGAHPDPHLLVAALHEWLNAPEADAARRGDATTAVVRGRSGWERPAALHQSSWLRQAGFGANADPPGGRGNVGPVVTSQLAAVEVVEVNDEVVEAALQEEAERQAEALFDEELQRRLQQATAAAARRGTGTASIATGGGGNQGELRPPPQRQLPVPSSPLRTSPPPLKQQEQSQQQPTPLQKPPPPPQQQQLVGERPAGRHESPSMLTTDLLAAAAVGSGSGAGSSVSGLLPYRMIGGMSDDGFLYDSPLLTGPPHPSEVMAAVRRSLSRAGYQAGVRDPTALRSLLLLSRGELMWLLESFDGGPRLDTSGQGREQLATRLLDMMTTTTRVNEDSGAGSSSSSTASSTSSSNPGAGAGAATTETGVPLTPQVEQAVGKTEKPGRGIGTEMESGRGLAPGGGNRRRAVTWLRQEVRMMEGCEEEVWDDDRAALGDPRRRQVLAAARWRQQLMEAAARPEEIATWLVKARAQDVVVISSDPDSEGETGRGTRDLESGSGVGSRSRVSYMVLATALSQRHAYACAEAVRFQIRERLEEMLAGSKSLESSEFRSGSTHSGSTDTAFLRGAPSVSGFNGADWLSLEAGRVQVHVLTPQARRYYRLEELLGGSSGGFSRRSSSRFRGDPRTADWGMDGPAARPWLHDRNPPVPSESSMSQSSAEPSSPPPLRPRMRLFGPESVGGGGRLLDTLETAQVETAEGP